MRRRAAAPAPRAAPRRSRRCLVLAVLVALVAVDVARLRTTLPADDVRFTAGAPPAAGAREARPFDAGERLLGVRDDVAFRSMLQLLRSSRLLDYTVSDPVLAIRRTELAERLESIMVRDPDPALRSRVQPAGCGQRRLLELDGAPVGTQQDRSELLLAAVADFEQAIAPTRRTTTRIQPPADAAARRGAAADRGRRGSQPVAGRQGSRGAGAGAPGSGY